MMDLVLEYVTKSVKKTSAVGGLVEVSLLRKATGNVLKVAFERNREYSIGSGFSATRKNSRGRVCDALYSDAEALRAVRRIFAEAYPGSE